MTGSRTNAAVSYRHPDDLDGEPAEVARMSLESLRDLLSAAVEVAEAANRQLRNAAMEEEPELSGDFVVEWDRSLPAVVLDKVKDQMVNAIRAIDALNRGL